MIYYWLSHNLANAFCDVYESMMHTGRATDEGSRSIRCGRAGQVTAFEEPRKLYKSR